MLAPARVAFTGSERASTSQSREMRAARGMAEPPPVQTAAAPATRLRASLAASASWPGRASLAGRLLEGGAGKVDLTGIEGRQRGEGEGRRGLTLNGPG